jgi:endoplasmic reticulum-Golgi intermediate compartment protein 3
VSWSFGTGQNIEQCEREHYSEHLKEQRQEGCRIEGAIRVNKVIGNFHFAPGKSFSNGNLHMHDLDVYLSNDGQHTFSHKIHHLRFGPMLPDSITKKMEGNSGGASLHPLDHTEQITDDKVFNYMYFIKVVSTAYLPLGWDNRMNALKGLARDIEHPILGAHGLGIDGSIEAHQYSVTSHKRSLAGGSDAAEGHKERLHARGGIPGVFFAYVSNPGAPYISKNIPTRPGSLTL